MLSIEGKEELVDMSEEAKGRVSCTLSGREEVVAQFIGTVPVKVIG